VLDAAAMTGWLRAHFRGVRIKRMDGTVYYQTPVQADGAGFPDLVLIRDRIIYAELKGHKYRKLEPEQVEWRDRIVSAGGEYHLWRPEDKDLIIDTLGKGRIKDER
jgi:hypothetical protein